MAQQRTYVFTIAQHFWELRRRIGKYGSTVRGYLTPDQVTDLNTVASAYDLHYGAGSSTWVPFRQQP